MHGKWLQQTEDVLAASFLALVWLVPNHQLPWTAFHHELVMVAFLGAMLLLLAWQARQGLQVPWIGLVLLLLAMVPWLQHSMGQLSKFGTAFVSSGYVMATALAVMLGFSVRGSAAERFTTIFLLGLVLGGLLNVPIQLAQWFQWYSTDMVSWSSILVTPIGREQRPSGAILQPNLLATLQVWALLALTWLHVTRRVRFVPFVVGFSCLIVGLGLTQSRAGMLEVAVCTMALFGFARQWAGNRVCWTWLAMLSGLVIWSLNFQLVADFLSVRGAAEGRLSSIDGARIDAWRAFGMAILESPWWGYGLTDVGYPYILHAETHPAIYIGQRFAHAHNVVLDMALWLGLPAAIILLVAAVVWGVRRAKDALRQSSMVVPLLILTVFSMHAMLELPHQYLFLLVPVGLCAGLLASACNASVVLRLGRIGAVMAAIGLWAAAAAVSWDYFPYQERYTEWRYDSAKVGKKVELPLKPALVLTQLHDELKLYRMDFSSPLAPRDLKWIEETTRATTSGPAIFYTALAHGVSGNREEAQKWMKRYNAIVPPLYVDHVRRSWQTYQTDYPQLIGLDWPPFAGRRSTFRFEQEPGIAR